VLFHRPHRPGFVARLDQRDELEVLLHRGHHATRPHLRRVQADHAHVQAVDAVDVRQDLVAHPIVQPPVDGQRVFVETRVRLA
jgi:hypothetical protein